MSYQLPSERESPLVVLRAVLLHAARKKKNLAFLKHHYDRSIRTFNKRRFFIYPKFGYEIKNTQGEIIFKCVWIDPYNYDVLVIDFRERTTRFINAYDFLI